MKQVLKVGCIVCVTFIALVGCSATTSYSSKAHREVGFSVLPFPTVVSEDFSSLHSQIYAGFVTNGALVSKTTMPSEYSDIDIIKVDMPNNFYWKPSVFNEDKLLTHVLTRTCDGSVVSDVGRSGESKMDFADAFGSRAISLTKYGVSEQEAEVFGSQVRTGSLFGMSQRRQTRGFSNASPKHSYHRLPSRSILDKLSAPIEAARKGEFSLNSVSQAHGVYLCVQDNKIRSALMLNELLSYENGKAGRNTLYVAHYPHHFFDALGQDEAKRLVSWAATADASEQKARNQLDATRIHISNINEAHLKIWDKRLAATYTVGDRVCSYNNLVGNVEQIAGNKVKVLWTRELDEREGYFFGKLYPTDYDKTSQQLKYSYQDIQRLDWVTTSEIAECTILVK